MPRPECFIPKWSNMEYYGAGVDWVRLIIPSEHYPADLRGFDMLPELYHHAGASSVGNSPKPFRVSGFQGFRLGRASLGIRDNLVWLDYSGDNAQEALELPYFEYANCTRLDVRVDMRLPVADDDMAEYMRDYYKEYRATRTRAGSWPDYDYRDKGGAQTLYIGSRDSWRFLRFYNKSAEQRWSTIIGQFWRAEIQFGKEQCNELAHRFQRDLLLSRTSYNLVDEYVESLGLGFLFGFTSEILALPKPERPSNDAEKRLAWLNKQVRPTIAKLAEAGYYEKAEQALGLFGLDTRK